MSTMNGDSTPVSGATGLSLTGTAGDDYLRGGTGVDILEGNAEHGEVHLGGNGGFDTA